jgi:hypothetical protein
LPGVLTYTSMTVEAVRDVLHYATVDGEFYGHLVEGKEQTRESLKLSYTGISETDIDAIFHAASEAGLAISNSGVFVNLVESYLTKQYGR